MAQGAESSGVIGQQYMPLQVSIYALTGFTALQLGLAYELA
jgi:hypothetical protein